MGLITSIRKRQRRKREQRVYIVFLSNDIRSPSVPVKVHHGPFEGEELSLSMGGLLSLFTRFSQNINTRRMNGGK